MCATEKNDAKAHEAISVLAPRAFEQIGLQALEGMKLDSIEGPTCMRGPSDRIIESVRLLRKMGLQAIICTPPDKLPDIMPLADRTHLVIKEKYQMHTKAWGKEILPA